MVGFSPAEVKTKIVGASPEQEQLLREILGGLGSTAIESLQIVEPEKDWGAPADAVALEASLDPNGLTGGWHVMLVANAFEERSRDLGLPAVAAVADRYSGTPIESASTLVDRPELRTREKLTLKEARELAERVHETSAKQGAESRIEILKPHRPAFFIELKVEDAASFLSERRHEKALAPLFTPERNDYAGYDGLYLTIDDGKPKPALAHGWYPFGGVGGGVRADLEGCAPGFGGSVMRRPPHCPDD